MIDMIRAAIVASVIPIGTGLPMTPNGHAQTGPAIFGQKSCSLFLQDAENERKARSLNAADNDIYTQDYLASLAYAAGFLSGANWATNANIGISVTDQLRGAMMWLEDYCRQNPFDFFVDAVVNLRNFLAAKEQQ